MKRAILVILASLAVGGIAVADEVAIGSSWVCSASGYDRNGQYKTVFGDYRTSQSDAEMSALTFCSLEGLGACQVSTCYEVEQYGQRKF